MSNQELSPWAKGVKKLDKHARWEVLVQAYIAQYTSPNTQHIYSIKLGVFKRWCDSHKKNPFKLTRVDFDSYKHYLMEDRGNKPTTLSHTFGLLRGFYSQLERDGLVKRDEVKWVKLPRTFTNETKTEGLDRNELTKFLHVAKNSSEQDYAMVMLMAYVGLRASEVCSVKAENFSTTKSGYRVLKITGKGRKDATIPLTAPVWKAVKKHIKTSGRKSGLLFYRPWDNQPMDRRALGRVVRRLSKKCDWEKSISPHSLRHAFITNSLDSGASIRDVQVGARHEDVRTTLRYDRARVNIERHPVHNLTVYLAGTY